MARLQILQLPEDAGDERPPFILVIDQAPQDEAGFEALRRDLEASDITERTGARAVLCFEETIEIPANTAVDSPTLQRRADRAEKRCDELRAESLRRGKVKLEYAERIRQLETELDEARQWARHGYEIGQRHCGWSDHGVAPAWLTEGWPRTFGSCEHLKQAAEFDEALSRVRALPTEPEIMNAQQEHPSIWRHGYHCGVLAAKAAIRPRNEPGTGG